MTLQFTKMHGLGNDFMVIDAIHQQVNLTAEQIKHWADRHFGIGFDQLLLVEPAQNNQVEFTYRIFNADGGEVEQCGNGARCFARFVYDKGLTQNRRIRVATVAGELELQLEADDQVTVNMGIPHFTPASIPFQAEQPATHYPLDIAGQAITIGAVNLGNPHAVTQVEDVAHTNVAELGPLIESHSRFPERVNAGFMQIVDQNTIKLRVFERGSGETLACGSGACAAVVVGQQWNLLNEKVQVHLTGGTLNICWKGEGQPVMMTGPAETVYEGNIEL